MTELNTRADLEIFASELAKVFHEIPENLRLLVIVDPRHFKNLVNDIVPPWAEMHQQHPERFIYTSQTGIEFGVKQATK
jgi:hypothetical protein